VKSVAAAAREAVMTFTVGIGGVAARWSAALWPRRGTTPIATRAMSTTVEIDTGHTRSFGDIVTGVTKIVGLSSASANDAYDKRP